MQSNIPVITVDGPSGTGKGTVSAILCKNLGFNFLDSGALYRLLALASKNHELAPDQYAELTDLAANLDVKFLSGEIFLESQKVTDLIRTEECGNLASKIAVIPEVRQALVARQHAFKQPPGLVADGRDMGTVIFPDAQLKIFLTASAEVRAERRYNQLKQKEIGAKLADLFLEIKERDARDSSRAVSPLKPADDAIIIDTSAMNVDDVVAKVLQAWDSAQG